MKVLLLGAKSQFASPNGSGVDRYMHELSKNLAAIKPPGFHFTKADYDPLPFMYNGFTPFVRSLTDDFSGYDIVHNLDTVPISRIRYGNAVSINTVHEFRAVTAPELDPESHESLRRSMGYRFVLLPGIKSALNADYLICNSTQTRQEAIGLGYDKGRAFVVNHGLDRRFLSKIHAKKAGRKFMVGYIGSLSTAKNVQFAIKAFKGVDDPDASFEIWGRQIYQYEHLVNAASGDSRISFKGYVLESKLVDTFDRFDVFLQPTLYEGFGLPILEAQARGLPVIIYKKGRIAKEVRKYCIEVDSVEQMTRMIEQLKVNGYNDKQKKRAMGYARSFTWAKLAKGTLEIYKKVMASG